MGRRRLDMSEAAVARLVALIAAGHTKDTAHAALVAEGIAGISASTVGRRMREIRGPLRRRAGAELNTPRRSVCRVVELELRRCGTLLVPDPSAPPLGPDLADRIALRVAELLRVPEAPALAAAPSPAPALLPEVDGGPMTAARGLVIAGVFPRARGL